MAREPLPPLRDFPWHLDIPTRWGDHDAYGHVNNAVHYSVFETTIMRWLEIEHGLDTASGSVRCFTVENGCCYHAPLKHPATMRCGLRIDRLGTSSVRYALAIFIDESCVATGFVVDVFVSAADERPVSVPEEFRQAMGPLMR